MNKRNPRLSLMTLFTFCVVLVGANVLRSTGARAGDPPPARCAHEGGIDEARCIAAAALAGDIRAEAILGELYSIPGSAVNIRPDDLGLPPYVSRESFRESIARGRYWLEKAANSGDREAMYNLARLYQEHSSLIFDNYSVATRTESNTQIIKWLERSADLGYPGAAKELGYFYQTTHWKPNFPNYEMAIQYYKLGASQHDSNAELALGDLYYHGFGVPADRDKAHAWYVAAAQDGDASGVRYFETESKKEAQAREQAAQKSRDEAARERLAREEADRAAREYTALPRRVKHQMCERDCEARALACETNNKNAMFEGEILSDDERLGRLGGAAVSTFLTSNCSAQRQQCLSTCP